MALYYVKATIKPSSYGPIKCLKNDFLKNDFLNDIEKVNCYTILL